MEKKKKGKKAGVGVGPAEAEASRGGKFGAPRSVGPFFPLFFLPRGSVSAEEV